MAPPPPEPGNPYRTRHKVTPYGCNFELRAGEEGEIYAVQGDKVRVSIPRIQEKAVFLPRNSIQYGHGKVGVWNVHIKHTKPIETPYVPNVGTSPLYQVALRFYTELRENQEKLDLIEGSMNLLGKLGDTTKVKELARRTEIAFKNAGMDATFNKPAYSVSDILTNAVRVSKYDREAIVYLWVHSRPGTFDYLYSGETGNSGKRKDGHESAARTSTTTHYKKWRQRSEHRMVKLCLFDDGSKAGEPFRFLVELFVQVVLLETPPRFMVEDNANSVKNAMDEAEADFEDQDEDEEEPSYIVPEADKKKKKALVFAWKKNVAQKMHQIATGVKNTLRWPGGCTRNSFGGPNGKACGTNINTPFTNCEPKRAPTTWTKNVYPNVMDVYRRSANRLGSGKGKQPVLITSLSSPGYSSQYDIYLSQEQSAEVGPKPKTRIHLAFEIMHDQPHKVPWARLPDFNLMDDWEEANRLGLSIMWEEDGQWKKMYCQSSLHGQMRPNQPPQSYCIAISIIRAFQQQPIKEPRPSWMLGLNPQIVQEVRFDHLTQTLHIKDLTVKDQVDPPKRRHPDLIMHDLKNLGAVNIGGAFKTFKDGSSITKQEEKRMKAATPFPATVHRHTQRKFCDRCQCAKERRGPDQSLYGSLETGRMQCTQVDGKDYCKPCHDLLGLPCSWTQTDLITPEYKDAVLHKPLQAGHTITADVDAPETLNMMDLMNPMNPSTPPPQRDPGGSHGRGQSSGGGSFSFGRGSGQSSGDGGVPRGGGSGSGSGTHGRGQSSGGGGTPLGHSRGQQSGGGGTPTPLERGSGTQGMSQPSSGNWPGPGKVRWLSGPSNAPLTTLPWRRPPVRHDPDRKDEWSTTDGYYGPLADPTHPDANILRMPSQIIIQTEMLFITQGYDASRNANLQNEMDRYIELAASLFEKLRHLHSTFAASSNLVYAADWLHIKVKQRTPRSLWDEFP